MTGRRKVHAAGTKRGHACDTAAPYDDLDVTDDWGRVTCRLCLYRLEGVSHALGTVRPWDVESDYHRSNALTAAEVYVPDRVWDAYWRAYDAACVDHARAVLAAHAAGEQLPAPTSRRVS